ncbi:hypothetical protein Poly21_22660 [Allorhodopirellula heiligendammensis]|uniref:Uncharacterized protein n=1 Tax=Allorhodopirellula heiligendammensis TaxID=2714739 RepID=A0A5C6BWD7_9BACT|nr:hypothetical protein Poly21_22660 [Allorhodopirellula heiligendammensis]
MGWFDAPKCPPLRPASGQAGAPQISTYPNQLAKPIVIGCSGLAKESQKSDSGQVFHGAVSPLPGIL